MDITAEFDSLVESLATRFTVYSPISCSILLNGSKGDSPDVILSVGVHGNEWTVVKGVIDFLQTVETDKKILFLFSNPEALVQEKRFIDYDMNRIFYSDGVGQELTRVKEIESVLSDCKYFADLHLTQMNTKKTYGIFETTPANLDFFTSMNDGITDIISSKALNDKGLCFDEAILSKNHSAVALTLELGSILDEEQKIIDRVKTVISEFICAIDSTSAKKEVTIWEQKQFVKNTPENALVKGLVNFQEVSKGDVLTKSGITAEYDGIVLFPKYAATTDSWLVRLAIKKQS